MADFRESKKRRLDAAARMASVGFAMMDVGSDRSSQLPSMASSPSWRWRLGDIARLAPRPLSLSALIIALGGTVPIIANCLSLPQLDALGVLPIVTFASIFIGSLVAGLTGFAFSAVTGALLFHWLAPSAAVPLLLACSITTQLFSITALWRAMQWKECVPLLLGGLPGIPVGAYVLQHVGPEIFAVGFGAFLVLYSACMLWRPGTVVRSGGRPMALIVGFAGGIAGGAIAFPGASPAIWCSLRALPKEVQRGIVQPFILLMQCAALLYFSKIGILGAATVTTFVWCVPAVLGGTWIGIRLYRRIDDTMYRRVILGFLLVSGATLIV
jgi:uncharacterized membrane protein YfcA